VHFAGAHAGEAHSWVEYTAKRHGPLAAIVLSIFILVFELPMRWLYATVLLSPREGCVVFRGTALSCTALRSYGAGLALVCNGSFGPIVEPI
jgi:hypothetical protein